MPYIKQEFRKPIDKKVDELAHVIAALEDQEGAANYAISRLLYHVWKSHERYAQLNAIIGVLECVKLEFYRQIGASYEDAKIEENGPVKL